MDESKAETVAPAHEKSGAPPVKESESRPPKPWKRIAAVVAILLVVIVGFRWVWHSSRTESTDDAYVNGYVTFVAPRVAGQVAQVLVEDNNRVKKGDVLVRLDPEPFQRQVAIKQAALESAQAALVVAEAKVRGQIGQTRGVRFKLQHAIEDVNNQVAVLRARVATLEQSKASATLAQSEFERAKTLVNTKVTSAEEFDRKREALDVARAQMQQALESVYQARAALGLSREPEQGKSLSDVPADLDQTFSTVRQALAELMESAAQLGVISSGYDLTPKQVVEEFYRRDPGGDINKIYQEIIKTAPALKEANATVNEAQRNLEQAELDLSYCTVVAEIDGVIARRNVNPGNHVQIGQSLMSLRSLRDIWIDANFKETQLSRLRIGQKAEVKIDMYGGKHVFQGRISGFTMGTGSTLSLLPAQNATGNFVKVVQRLPVRIELTDYDPDKAPLFVGLSAEPEIDIVSEPTGRGAGKFLQDVSGAPAKVNTAAVPRP
jgi:membrane fusion protein (multidrug efflux system)